jgi:SAM-dependent methyltransferase
MPIVRTISAASPATPVDGNRRYYERRRVGAHYASKSQPDPPEAEILRRYRADIAGGRTLDLGVGGGRTTSFLSDFGCDYVGIDYSTKMIERCRGRFPGVRFEVMDARDLSAFADASFDFILFSKAGIDAVGHEDRLAVLSEVDRTLNHGGLFVFSSHNRNAHIPGPWNVSHFDVNLLRDPVRFAKRVGSYPLGIVNYLRNAGRKQVHEEYCVQVDSGDMYSLVHYRIEAAAQARQLERAGFCDVEAVGTDGRWLPVTEWETAEDPSIHYVCRNKSRRR